MSKKSTSRIRFAAAMRDARAVIEDYTSMSARLKGTADSWHGVALRELVDNLYFVDLHVTKLRRISVDIAVADFRASNLMARSNSAFFKSLKRSSFHAMGQSTPNR